MIETNNQPNTEVKKEETINSVPLTAPEVTPEVKKEVKVKTAPKAPKSPKAKVEVEVEKKVKKEKPIVDIALVMNGKIEVRKYTIQDHGENFVELANEFASKKGYEVVTLKEVIKTESNAPIEDPENFVVVKKNGLTIRTYSLSVHGEDFKKLAKQFAEKNDYQI